MIMSHDYILPTRASYSFLLGMTMALFIVGWNWAIGSAQEPVAKVAPAVGPMPPPNGAKAKVPPAPIRQRRLVASQGPNDKLPLQRDPFSTSPRMESEYQRLNVTGNGVTGPVLPPLRLQGYAGNVAMLVIDDKQKMVVRVGETVNLAGPGRMLEVKIVELADAGVTIEIVSTGQTFRIR